MDVPTSPRQRLVAILAADAVDYSRLMARDSHTTLIALDAARAIFRTRIEAHAGRVVDMAGDSSRTKRRPPATPCRSRSDT